MQLRTVAILLVEDAELHAAQAMLSNSRDADRTRLEAQRRSQRERLRDAVRSIETVCANRDPAPEDDFERVELRGLVDTRWCLVDHVDVDGRRYLLAREDDAIVEAPVVLTDRERQVLSLATRGHRNKLIAYELGIADSTVRVLLARAAAKLGTSKRTETLRAFAAWSRVPPSDA